LIKYEQIINHSLLFDYDYKSLIILSVLAAYKKRCMQCKICKLIQVKSSLVVLLFTCCYWHRKNALSHPNAQTFPAISVCACSNIKELAVNTVQLLLSLSLFASCWSNNT